MKMNTHLYKFIVFAIISLFNISAAQSYTYSVTGTLGSNPSWFLDMNNYFGINGHVGGQTFIFSLTGDAGGFSQYNTDGISYSSYSYPSTPWIASLTIDNITDSFSIVSLNGGGIGLTQLANSPFGRSDSYASFIDTNTTSNAQGSVHSYINNVVITAFDYSQEQSYAPTIDDYSFFDFSDVQKGIYLQILSGRFVVIGQTTDNSIITEVCINCSSDVSSIPEPETYVMMLAGLVLLVFMRRKGATQASS